MPKLKYKRVLLKLSGEVFKGNLESGIEGKTIIDLAKRVAALQKMKCEVGIVIGGGNIWRFRDNKHLS